MMVKHVDNAGTVQTSTPPTTAVPPERIHAFVGHGIVNGHHGTGIKLMLERRRQIEPNFLFEHPCGKRRRQGFGVERGLSMPTSNGWTSFTSLAASSAFLSSALVRTFRKQHPCRPRESVEELPLHNPKPRHREGCQLNQLHGQLFVAQSDPQMTSDQGREQRRKAVVNRAARNSVSNCWHDISTAIHHKKPPYRRVNLQEGVCTPAYMGKAVALMTAGWAPT